MVRTQQRDDDVRDVHGHEAERGVPDRGEVRALEAQQLALAPGEHRAHVALITRRRLVQRAVVPTAPQRVLDDEPPVRRVPLAPREVQLAVEREGGAFVGRVADGEEGDEGGPEQEGVHGEDGAGVEDGAGDADEEGEAEDRGRDRDEHQDVVVRDEHHVCVHPGLWGVGGCQRRVLQS